MSENKNVIEHPSVYLNEYLKELEITPAELSKHLGISGDHLASILNKKARITVDVAKALAALLGTSVELWLNLQDSYDQYVHQGEV